MGSDNKVYKSDSGSTTVEACIVVPIIVFSVFLVINMFIAVINCACATGEAYFGLYTKEMYVYNMTSGDDTSSISGIGSTVKDNLKEQMSFVEKLDVKAIFDKSTVFKKSVAGDFVVKVNYSSRCIGIPPSIGDNLLNQQIEVKEQIRDTSNNLRRWQIYGEILSD